MAAAFVDGRETARMEQARPHNRLTLKFTLALLTALTMWSLAASSAWAAPAALRYGRLVHACGEPTPTDAACFAVLRLPVPAGQASAAGVQAYRTGAGAVSHGEAGGLTPEDLETAYQLDSEGGVGQTVAIVDAYDDPRIEADLTAFDKRYGIQECSECFRKLNQEGRAGPLPAKDTIGWSVEISLDVEAVRAICHGCKIVLLEARSPSYANLADAVSEAGSLGADEISNSYGGPEQGIEESADASAFDQPGRVVTAATGDDGWEDWNLKEGSVNAPASLPDVVSVGGTSLKLQSDGARESETVWNDYGGDGAEAFKYPGYATGGGCSGLFAAQLWQQRAPGFAASGCGDKRLAADVAADADPYTGLDVYDSYDYCTTNACREQFLADGDWHTVGGTSLATPLIAAMYALAGGAQGVAYPALSLYGHLGEASLYDVTEGGNGFCDGESPTVCGDPNGRYDALLDCEGTTACDAAPGLDGPSGVGVPTGLEAFKPRLPGARISAPATIDEGASASFDGAGSSDPYPGGKIVTWRWQWGDGGESAGAEPTHTYAKAGEYTVTLTVTDEYGLSASSTVQVSVEASSRTEREAHEREAHEREEREAKERSEREAHERQEREAREHREREEREQREREAVKTIEPTLPAAALKVESFKATATPDVMLQGLSYAVSPAGVLTVKLSCPTGETRCSGTIALRLRAGRTTTTTIASGSFSIAGGARTAVRLRLSRSARALLGRKHRLSVRASIQASDPAGARHTTTATLSLHGSKRT